MPTHHNPTPAPPKRVVILGANGFVARDLSSHLAEVGVPNVAVGSTQVDLLQADAVEKLRVIVGPDDALVITSALTPEKGKDVRTFMKNLTMANQVCAFFETGKCAHVIYLSSDAVYDESQALVSEATPRTGLGLYGLMHAAREQMLQFAAATAKIPLCIVRPCAIYGAGDTHNSYGPNRFFRTALRDRKISLFGGGEEQRDHIYIRDVSRFIALCLARRTEGAVDIVTGRAVSFSDLSHIIINLCPHSVQIENLARPVGAAITHRQFDISPRLRAFPEFHTTPLADGLAEMARELLKE